MRPPCRRAPDPESETPRIQDLARCKGRIQDLAHWRMRIQDPATGRTALPPVRQCTGLWRSWAISRNVHYVTTRIPPRPPPRHPSARAHRDVGEFVSKWAGFDITDFQCFCLTANYGFSALFWNDLGVCLPRQDPGSSPISTQDPGSSPSQISGSGALWPGDLGKGMSLG